MDGPSATTYLSVMADPMVALRLPIILEGRALFASALEHAIKDFAKFMAGTKVLPSAT